MDEIVTRNDVSLYESDFYAWTQQQAALLREGQLDALDLVNVLEEIEALGRKELAELRSRYVVLALHLLKQIYQPERATHSWRTTIFNQRLEIELQMEDNPSLKPKAEAAFARAYVNARRLAAWETKLPSSTFPAKPPITLDQALSTAWNPGRDTDEADEG